MKKLTANQIRESWLTFFKKNDHIVVPSASLIPKNDKSLLWINSGVATLKDYFSGKTNPPYKNLTNSQKAIRTNDIFNVGLTSRHHTFFEMLGNFSIGGYFKEKAIELAYKYLTQELEININNLYITVFEDDNITLNEWIKHGINKNHIIKCGRDRNFWDVGSGPCGPCTEIFYDRGKEFDPENIGEKLFFEDLENDRYVEIWNIVFSQFNNDGNNNYTELSRKNIDTGAGLERLACISQNTPTNFDTDLFSNIINEIEKHTDLKYKQNNYFKKELKQTNINFSYKVIADHMRAVVFAIADGAIPYSKDRGYILRRLIRRVIVMLHKLNIKTDIFNSLVEATIDTMSSYYNYLINEKEKIIEILNREFKIFNKTLNHGLKLFEESAKKKDLNKYKVFKLVETYGFPFDLIEELANERNIKLDVDGFNELFKKHQIISNGSNEKNAMLIQNAELLNLKTDFQFIYDVYELESKVVKLFDKNLISVESIKNDEGYIVLDKTCFYATSGGQLHDFGCINEKIFIDDVFKGPNLQHIHHSNNINNLSIGDIVKTKIDVKNRELTRNNHSVEHLLHAALCNVVDKNIKQEGAFKSAKKVTFDFKHHLKLDSEILLKLEKEVNQVINNKLPVEVLHLSLDDAKAIGAKAYFEDVYKKIKGNLRVIKMGDYSIELCGGTHVNNTFDIEKFKIISYYPKGSGSWRIEAITTNDTIDEWTNNRITSLNDDILHMKSEYKELNSKNEELEKLFDYNIDNYNLIDLVELNESIHKKLSIFKVEVSKITNANEIEIIKKEFNKIKNKKIKIHIFNNLLNKNIFNALNELVNENQDIIYFAFNLVNEEKIQYIFATNKKNNINLNEYIKPLNQLTDGKGGGKPFNVQGGCKYENLEKIKDWIEETQNA